MKKFYELLQRTTSSGDFSPMVRFCKPLEDHFLINHFWYYRIKDDGNYCYLGTNAAWSEYCFDMALIDSFPCLRHPRIVQSGINLMNNPENDAYKALLEVAAEKFKVHFNLNLVQRYSDGVEAFGFATKISDPKLDERLLNELPLLRHFCSQFRQKHKRLLASVQDNEVNLPQHFGGLFYQQPTKSSLPNHRVELLRGLGFGWIESLTLRERDIMHYLASGFSSSYIAKELCLSHRTVENYIAKIKDKLTCSSKSSLICLAKAMCDLI